MYTLLQNHLYRILSTIRLRHPGRLQHYQADDVLDRFQRR